MSTGLASDAIPSNGEVVLAPNACSSCKKQKRKCDKILPKCSLCARIGRDCSYAETVQSTGDALDVLRSRIGELEALLLQKHHMMEEQKARQKQEITPHGGSHNNFARLVNANPFERFPALFFLDNEMFREARMTIPKPAPLVPDDIYAILGDVDGLRRIADRYFSETHIWLPILSKKRFQIMLNDSSLSPTPELTLLFSAMHLISDERPNYRGGTQNNTYWSVKNYAFALESNAVMTLQLLQAMVLIAAYEVGHAIYPAAYLSIGKCAALGKALGVDNRRNAPQMVKRFGAWAELEEIRRIWWAIFLLDRYANLGLQGHDLATQDPANHALLPALDTAFDEAEMVTNEPLYIDSPSDIPAGAFARACQASHLVGRVVAVLNDFQEQALTRFEDATRIYQILTAFINVVRPDFERSPEEFATPMALAYSAMIALCDPFCCTDTMRGIHTAKEIELQKVCIAGIKNVADDIAKFSIRLQPSMQNRPSAISPLIAHCLYMATVTFSWLVYEVEKTENVDLYRVVRDALMAVNTRWAVGGEYIFGVDKGRELLYPTPLLQS